ncbi:MAG: nickel pincer cofactor biosynthesis protein LarC [Verrucomicrobia bacterium]|nr:nickel pincer cofactor biosynthesis protein LarC [Verrucomicrobiota bacterium]
MNSLYLDLFSGISGDMFLGALIDLGVDAARLETELRKLGVGGYHLHISRDRRGGMSGTRFDVHLEEEHHSHHPHHHEPEQEHRHGRTFLDIRGIIERSALSSWVKEKAVAIFQRVADAEGKIHGRPADQVHFHEVGAVDSIVDITGACLALEMLDRPRVLASAVVEGTGSVKCAHGQLPLPAPATLEILTARGVEIGQCEEPHELVTPTGAALLAEFAVSFGPMRGLKALRIGYGLGLRENQTRPNVLRAVLAEATAGEAHDWETDTVAVLETNLDDVNAEIMGSVLEQAIRAGALDVFHTPIQMKKSRPGVLLTVLCNPEDADRFSEMLLRETSAFGVRRTMADRRKLRREIVTVATSFGGIEVKIGRLDGQLIQAAPEFESCRQAATQAKVPLKQVYAAALKALDIRV